MLVQDLHQSAAAEGNDLAGLDVHRLIAGNAVDIGVIGRADGRDLLLLLFGQAFNMEYGGLVLGGNINANGLQLLGAAHAVTHLDPEGLQLGSFGGMLGGELYDILINADLHCIFLLKIMAGRVSCRPIGQFLGRMAL